MITVPFLPVGSYRSRRVWLWSHKYANRSLPIARTFGKPNDDDPEGGAGYLTNTTWCWFSWLLAQSSPVTHQMASMHQYKTASDEFKQI
jgi:hypothetical protein